MHFHMQIGQLQNIDLKFRSETDIRAWGINLILNHDPFKNGERLENYLDEYLNGKPVLIIEEGCIESLVLGLITQRSQIKKYFLLDIEFTYL